MRIIKTTSHSVTIRISTKDIYYTSPYEVFLNDEFFIKDNRNVITLFNLKPNTEYKLNVSTSDKILYFTTDKETMFSNVKDFGAIGDGINDDTAAFQLAIATLLNNGTLYVGKGKYYLKPIYLKSNMTLYLDKDAELIFETDRNKYPYLPPLKLIDGPLGTWQGDKDIVFASPLTLINLENVNIIGEGTINCNALNSDWYINHRVKRKAWRPFGVFINNCKHICINGLTIKDTASWNVHPYFSKDLSFFNLTLLNPKDMPTTDGIDIDSCENVVVAGCDISVGDDCIAIKSGTYEFIKEFGVHPSKNIKIENCLMRSGHGGVVFGSESSSGIDNVIIKNCLFQETDRGFRLKTRRLRGNIPVTNVKFKNIIMDHVLTPFVINMFYNMGPTGGHEEIIHQDYVVKDETTPKVENFIFENITCNDVDIAAGVFLGLKESPILSLTFKNCTFNYKDNALGGNPVMIENPKNYLKAGLIFSNVKTVNIFSLKMNGVKGNDYVLDNVKELFKK